MNNLPIVRCFDNVFQINHVILYSKWEYYDNPQVVPRNVSYQQMARPNSTKSGFPCDSTGTSFIGRLSRSETEKIDTILTPWQPRRCSLRLHHHSMLPSKVEETKAVIQWKESKDERIST